MNGNEFKAFWEILQSLYPFAFKTEGAMRLWAERLKAAPYAEAVIAVRRWKHENDLCRTNFAPEPEDIAKSAKYYRGYSKIFYTALMRNNGIPFNEEEIDA